MRAIVVVEDMKMLTGNRQYIFTQLKQLVMNAIASVWSFAPEAELKVLLSGMEDKIDWTLLDDVIEPRAYANESIVKGRVNWKKLASALERSVQDAYLLVRTNGAYWPPNRSKIVQSRLIEQFSAFERSRKAKQ